MRIVTSLLVASLLASPTMSIAKPRRATPTAAPLRIVIPIVEPKCATTTPGEQVITVCGRKDDRFRIDPTVMAANQLRDSRGGQRVAPHTTMFGDDCSGIGLSRCAGQGVVPVSSIAIVAATMAYKLAKGEDIRPMLRPVPSEYELYKQAKEARDLSEAE